MSQDYVCIPDVERELWIVHDPECLEVTKARAGGKPMLTMQNCAEPLTGDGEGLVRHACLRPGDS